MASTRDGKARAAHSRTSLGIIGTGWVGTSVAMSVLHTGAVRELLLHDVRERVAEGEAMDLSHGSSFYPSADVRAVPVDEMLDTDAVVIAAGRGGKPAETRLQLLDENVAIIRDLARRFVDYRGIVVMVSNPVDVLTYAFQQFSGLPPERVIGTGTMLDTARLRQMLGAQLDVDPRSIHAQVVGEHGDSEVVLWSSANIGGQRLRAWPGWTAARETALADEVRGAAQQIIRRKGATNHAIGLVTATLLRWMLRGERRVLNVSRVQTGHLGLADVSLSLPTLVGARGATDVLEPELDAGEREALEHSADVLRAAWRGLVERAGS